MSRPSRKLLDKDLYADVVAEAKERFDVWPSAYASGWVVKTYKARGGRYAGATKGQRTGLTKWFGEEWVDLSRPIHDEDGELVGYEPCGRKTAQDASNDPAAYPKCRPLAEAMRMSPSEVKDAIKRKRAAEAKAARGGRGARPPVRVATYRRNPASAIQETTSPLQYHHDAPVYRLQVVDESAPPPDPRATYFAETTRTVRKGKNGQPLKTPRVEVTPGADEGVVAFLDFHRVPSQTDAIYIDYMATRDDQRGKGHATALVDKLYGMFPDAAWIDWGDIMSDAAWRIFKTYRDASGVPSYGKLRNPATPTGGRGARAPVRVSTYRKNPPIEVGDVVSTNTGLTGVVRSFDGNTYTVTWFAGRGTGGGWRASDLTVVRDAATEKVRREKSAARKASDVHRALISRVRQAAGLPDWHSDEVDEEIARVSAASDLAAYRATSREGAATPLGARAKIAIWSVVRGRENPRLDGDAFRRWFGDSKVVDAQGEPLVVYHGTNKSFDVFKSTTKEAFYGKGGMYFSNVREAAQTFAPSVENVMTVYLALQNPYFDDGEDGGVTIAKLKRRGFDGIVREADFVDEDGDVQDHTIYVAFYPEQIKLADGTNTTFDPANPDVRANPQGFAAIKAIMQAPEGSLLVSEDGGVAWRKVGPGRHGGGDWARLKPSTTSPDGWQRTVDAYGQPMPPDDFEQIKRFVMREGVLVVLPA